MKTQNGKIHNLYLELKQKANAAPVVAEGSLYDTYRSFFLPDFFKRRAMELEIAMRAKSVRLSALCKIWENRAINLFQKADEYVTEHHDQDAPQVLLLQEMGQIYCEKSGELRLSIHPKTLFEFILNIFLKYTKRPGAGRF